MTPAARLFLGLVAVASFSSGLKAESCGTFDVASIKLNTSGVGGGYPELAPGGKRFNATNKFMIELIMYAYDVSPLQVSGIPSAFSGERYDIEATCEQPMAKEQLPRMLQLLLAERFHLSIHRQLKEQPVYALILGKGGPKLHETSDEGGKPSLRQSGHSFTFTNAAMSNLVGVLSQVTGRKVLDRTGLRGQYDFTLSYAPDRGGAGGEGSNVSPAADSFPESVFTALREQLGLNLEAQKGQVEFIVVDHLDRLIPN
ncbi:MAG TPA: TIGR03435 family protein [Bryobacteraceae bacterium]|nr:TIGR03435 family protein [Bryobacteraceae bacterium]